MRSVRFLPLVVFVVVGFVLLSAPGAAAGGGWSKLKAEFLPWPKKGPANRLPAYRILSSPEEDFLNFSFAPADRYRLDGESLLLRAGGKEMRLKKGSRPAKISLRLNMPDGSKGKADFEIFPPDDPGHWSAEGDKIQWKMRNRRACFLKAPGGTLLLLDADCDGSFFTFGADRMCRLSAERFKKGDFDPSSLEWAAVEWWLQTDEARFALLAPAKGGAQLFELPEGYDPAAARALGYLNWMRWQNGAPPVSPVPLSMADKAPWIFTARAATPLLGVRAALCTLYHRNMLMQPKLDAVGFAFENGALSLGGDRKAWNADFSGVYPFRGQRGVLLRNYPEEPSPLREGEENFAGHIVSVRAPSGFKLVSAEMRPLGGEPLKLSVSSPESPPPAALAAGWRDNKKGITFLPEEPLRPGTIYAVKVRLAGGKGEERTIEWMFMTEAEAVR